MSGNLRDGLINRESVHLLFLTFLLSLTVTDMLIAILNVCSKEELEEEEEEDAAAAAEAEAAALTNTVASTSQLKTEEEETAERRAVIKNKILAVGRMSRVFALLR